MMPRKIRFIPPEGALVELGLRCLDAQFLLTPSDHLNELLVGVLARAQRRTGLAVIAVVAMSGHIHLMARADNAGQVARFMEYAAGNAAREIARLRGRRHKIWECRYAQIIVAEDEAAYVARLRYFLEHGCKENLVESPRDWPGLHPASAILSGRPLKGVWYDRTGFYRAMRRAKKGEEPRLIDFKESETLQLSPLPCWSHLSPKDYRRRIREMVEEIENETRQRHRKNGTSVAGRRAVLKQDPLHRPKSAKRQPAPLVHGGSKEARKKIREAYREFLRCFLAAAESLRELRPSHGFPEGAFPSPLPFVKPEPILKPG